MAEASAAARVVYISYDGLEEPLGRSQVLPYVVRLAHDFEITVISFEKSSAPALEAEVAAAGVDWIPLRYHRRPPVLSTALDVMAGRRALRRVTRTKGVPAIIHVRSDVPALIALRWAKRGGAKLLFDIRGFWADERVEGGLWRPGGLLYRLAKRFERRFYDRADVVVTLTNASVPQIRAWIAPREVPVEVIPTCVDLGRFNRRPSRPAGRHIVWAGSVGTWYRFDLAARLAAALDFPLEVITRQVQLARQVLAGYPAAIMSLAPDEVPSNLFAGDIGLCLIASSFSKQASAPTRFAEYLAAGMPVVVTPAVGDLEAIVEARRIGVVLRGEDDAAMAEAAAQMALLVQDKELSRRCRTTAEELFDVDVGSQRYAQLFRLLIGTPPPGVQ
jgi:glycosyltransferase involved in cell wall biosynthesis